MGPNRMHCNLFSIRHLYILTLITRKVQAIYRRYTHQMTAVLSEVSVFCLKAGCKIRLVGYGSKHSSQFFSYKPFVHNYTLNLKTTSYIWSVSILNDCCSIKYIPCMVYSCKRESARELLPQTYIGCSLIENSVHILQTLVCTSLFGLELHMTTKLTYLMIAHQTTALLPTMHHL